MELSKFLQQDITEFLEQKATEQRDKRGSLRGEEFSLFDVDRDYAKETAKALDQGNLQQAKKIFADLRTSYNKLQGNDADREKLYAILKEVYAEIKSNIDHSPSLSKELEDFEKNELKDAPTPPSKRGAEQAPLPTDEETKKFEEEALRAEKERKDAEEAITNAEAAVSEALEKKDLQGAAGAYNKLKEAFTKYPSDDKFRKVEWYNQVLAAYERIKRLQTKLKEETEEKKKQTAAEKQQKKEQEKQEQEGREHLTRAKEKIKQLIYSLEGNDLHQTEALLIDARHLVAKIPKKAMQEKQGLESILSIITHRIQYLKQEEQRQAAARKREEEEKRRNEEEERKKREEEAIAHAKGNAEELYQEGLRYQHAGDTNKARICYQQILKISPHHLPAQIRLEQLNQASKREEAEAP